MSRYYHKGWQDKRSGWTRRARWYRHAEDSMWGTTTDIRIEFTDEDGKVNRFYKTEEEAQAEYDAFRANELSVLELMHDERV